ncbi:complex I NDUFA9 subunit family protein [Chromobacterium sp. S0633]|uniref:complex I NDUFA9 subunit family protein n=1 Tax=Chromobacterium sp. S0633 TaxID=2957805 RepID=UPI0020A1E4C6|nr:complex I NDUFA9 subunit family protein [Chromobacterium sp. S0633]MCP1292680.1 complex I NDUFA9 subunit family protein [Chromobacterium sp. S0633]
MTYQRICVIGGSGFIGSYIAERLTEQDCQLTIATRRRERAKASLLVLPGAQLVEADIHRPEALEQLISGHDAVINMVGILHGSAAQFDKAHVQLTEKVIAACRSQGVRRLIHISALGADERGPSLYQQSKGRAEARVRESGLEWTLLRPSVVFGHGDSFLNMFAGLLRKAPFLPLAGAKTRFAPIWAGDVAHAVAASLSRRAAIGQSLDLAGPGVYTLAELVSLVGRHIGKPRPVIALPQGLAMLQAALMECLPGPALISRDNVRSLSVDNVSDQPFPAALLGFSPTALEALAPALLGTEEFNLQMSAYRRQIAR